MADAGDIEGYIIPPPELRTIIDKTALFVGKNGKSFEARIRANEQGNLKFNFLKDDDPYHAYYLSKVKDAEDAKNGVVPTKKEPSAEEAAAAKAKAAEEAAKAEAEAIAAGVGGADGGDGDGSISKEAEHSRVGLVAQLSKGISSKEAPAPDVFTMLKPRLTPVELDTIKLTARFTAVSGREFLAGLAQRELSNPAFDFLKPTHMLFGFFTQLVDAYTRCLKPPKELKEKLGETLTSRNKVLQRCVHRLQWQRKQQQERSERETQASAEKVAYQSIDWHDFVVVETITFDDDDVLPAPTPADVELTAEAAEAAEAAREAAAEAERRARAAAAAEAKRKAADAAAAKRARLSAAGAGTEDDEEIVVRTDYKPSAATAAAKAGPKYFLDPRTGRQIPIEESEEHMRIELLDPKWKEQQQRALAGQATSQFASDDQIAANLSRLGRQRPDIFGGDELDERRKKQAADQAAARVIWDGSTGSVHEVQQQKALEQQQQQSRRGAGAPARQPQQPNIGPAAPSGVRNVPSASAAAAAAARAIAAATQFVPGAPARLPLPPPQQQQPPQRFMGPPGGARMMGPPGGGMMMMHPPPQQQPPPMMMMRPPPGPPPGPPRQQPQQQQQVPPPPPAAARAPPAAPAGGASVALAQELTGEAEFLASHSGGFTLTVRVPAELGGPTVGVAVQYASRLGEVKALLAPLLTGGGLRQNKMQLKHPVHGFMKDSLSLAHYNIDEGVHVVLVPKVRGR